MKAITVIFVLSFLFYWSNAQVIPGLHVEEWMIVLFGEETTGSGIKTFWLPEKAAFRAGAVGNQLGSSSDANAWDLDSIGKFSFASGLASIAKGNGSVSMGYQTEALGDQSIALGIGTKASGTQSVALGSVSKATNTYSTAMGRSTKAIGYGSTAMGSGTEASGYYSTAMGGGTDATGNYATATGRDTEASGDYSFTVGLNTTASGDTSYALGYGMSTNGKVGAFMIGDADPNKEGFTYSGVTNEMVARFWNGYYFLTSGDDERTGIRAPHGAIAWSSTCDENKKENFLPLDDEEILKKLSSVEFKSWNFKGQDSTQFRHYGIMAQEFFELFGQDHYGSIGCDTLVNPIDMMGITMSAIKGLKLRVDRILQENKNLIGQQLHLNKKINALIHENDSLKDRLLQLEQKIDILMSQEYGSDNP